MPEGRGPGPLALLVCAALLLGACEALLLPQAGASPSYPVDTAAPARQRQAQELADLGRQGVVRIVAGAATGSGAFLGDDRVLTVAHLLAATGTATVWFGGRAVGAARVIQADPEDDLVILSVAGLSAAGARTIPWGESAGLRVGDLLVGLSAPTSAAVAGTAGVVLALRGTGASDLIDTDAALGPAAAGGPVLNDRGELVAIAGVLPPGESARTAAVAFDTARSFVEAVQAGVGATEDRGPRALAPAVVARFFALIDARDYPSAWAMLAPRWQAQQPYEDFARGFAELRGVRFTPADAERRSAVVARVRGTVEASVPSTSGPGLARSTYTGFYDVGYRGGRWLLLTGALELSGRVLLRG